MLQMLSRLRQRRQRRLAKAACTRAAQIALSRAASKRIVLSAGGVCQPDWIATEHQFLDLCAPEDWTNLFQPASVAAMLAEHVWEHLSPADAATAARHCLRYLQPGGYLRLAVPDGLHPDPRYIELVRPGGSGAGSADHKVLYTHESLAGVLRQAGFEIRLLEHFDAAGRFYFHEWDPRDGMIWRSLRYDERNRDGQPHYVSIVLDAVKPPAARP